MAAPYVIEELSAAHDRSSFASGVAPLDHYLRTQARQDMKRRVSACYVSCLAGDSAVAGFYTLSAGEVLLHDLPEEIARRLPRYPVVPVARIGRLATDVRHQRKGLGAALLWDAMTRTHRSGLGVYATIVDAKDAAAAAFYCHHGFIPFVTKPLQLFMPLATIEGL
ncbi:GNAT superfamily N-acetyltransferase [Rhizobium aquaticum]|uniref:GNAT superfamily N-acetyltransferase n=1 Tax=Rhizobium aquaticum TaxID=1549636 RepID=A0ABV2IZ29_9HYPH